MRVSADTFWAPKAGNKESEYEDSFYPSTSFYSEANSTFRFSVADGATDSAFSGLWARILTRAFYKQRIDFPDPFAEVSRLRRLWTRSIKRDNLPWYTLARLDTGAFAAIVGLVLEERNHREGTGKWSALAVGDSCLFHLRDGQLLRSFPLSEAAAFNNSPMLVSSLLGLETPDILQTETGDWEAGDTFYLMTDAVACWFLEAAESGSLEWKLLRNLTAHESGKMHFRSWLDDLRRSKKIKNDDVTISRIEIEID